MALAKDGSGARLLIFALLFVFAGTADAASPPALLGYIDSAIDEGRDEQARQLLDNARALAGDTPEIRVRQIELRIAQDPEAARLALTSLLDTSAGADANALLARIMVANGDFETAGSLADRALALDRESRRAWMVCGIAADHARKWETSAKCHAGAVALAPHSAVARNNRGYSRLLQGLYADAEADFAAAIAIAPDRVRIRRNLQLVLALQGRYADALATSSDRARAEVFNLLGFAAIARGEDTNAAAYFSRARDAGGPESTVAESNLAYLAQRRTAAQPR